MVSGGHCGAHVLLQHPQPSPPPTGQQRHQVHRRQVLMTGSDGGILQKQQQSNPMVISAEIHNLPAHHRSQLGDRNSYQFSLKSQHRRHS